jgi:acetate kinase
MRVLENSAEPKAQQAVELFCYRAASEIGALIPLLGGLDALVFTAGIGEHSKRVRERINAYFGWLPALKTLVLETDEEAEIAIQIKGVLNYA